MLILIVSDQDTRFSIETEEKGGAVHCIMAVPVCNNEGDVIGVAQLINKKSGSDYYTEHDIEVSHFVTYH